MRKEKEKKKKEAAYFSKKKRSKNPEKEFIYLCIRVLLLDCAGYIYERKKDAIIIKREEGRQKKKRLAEFVTEVYRTKSR